jgi:hypothetical protein
MTQFRKQDISSPLTPLMSDEKHGGENMDTIADLLAFSKSRSAEKRT